MNLNVFTDFFSSISIKLLSSLVAVRLQSRVHEQVVFLFVALCVHLHIILLLAFISFSKDKVGEVKKETIG